MAGIVQRIAKRTGDNPDALAERIPEDTLRRLKYPVIEVPQEDGTILYKHDPGIVEGVRAEVRR